MKPKLKLSENFKFYACFCGLMVFLGAMFVLAAILTRPFSDMIVYLNNPNASRPWIEWIIFWFGVLLIGPFWTSLYLLFKVCEKRMLEYLSPPKKEPQSVRKSFQKKQVDFRNYRRAVTLNHRRFNTSGRSTHVR